MSSNEYLSSKNLLFKCLEELVHWFPDFSGNSGRVEKSVKWFIREFRFLDIFVSLQSFTDEPDMEQVTQKIHTLFQEAAIEFSELLDCITELEGFYEKSSRSNVQFSTRVQMLEFSAPPFSSIKSIFPFYISAPNLKNLKLQDFALHPRHLTEIALLQNLQVFSLKLIEFDSHKWEVRNGEFSQLKVLEVESSYSFIEWNVTAEDAFVKLEHLVLRDCKHLKEIPSCFGDICCLKSMEIEDCNEFVNKSSRDIWEAQVEDYQNTSFNLFINRKKYSKN